VGVRIGRICRALTRLYTKPREKALIIVESPTKARTIKKFLPARYVVKASVGHVRDLPKSSLGVDVDNDFAPRYLTIKGKGDVIKELPERRKERDGSLPRNRSPIARVKRSHGTWPSCSKLPDPSGSSFTRFTKAAALAALKDAHHIDMGRVNAQQARRILDRLVGYKISPLLWAKVRGGLSAGRVQSVTVKLIVDREREIAAFIPRNTGASQRFWHGSQRLAADSDVRLPPSSYRTPARSSSCERRPNRRGIAGA